jgi:hypothetical protein
VENRGGSGDFRLQRFHIENAQGQVVENVSSGDECSLVFEYSSETGKTPRELFLGVTLYTMTGTPVSVFNTNLMGQDFTVAPSHGRIRFHMPRLALTAGRYVMDLNLATNSGFACADAINGVAAFDVTDGDFYGTGRPGSSNAPSLIDGRWQLEDESSADSLLSKTSVPTLTSPAIAEVSEAATAATNSAAH